MQHERLRGFLLHIDRVDALFVRAGVHRDVTFRVANLNVIDPENATATNAATGQTVTVKGGETLTLTADPGGAI